MYIILTGAIIHDGEMNFALATPQNLRGLVVCHAAGILPVNLQYLIALTQLLADRFYLRHKEAHSIATNDFKSEPFR